MAGLGSTQVVRAVLVVAIITLFFLVYSIDPDGGQFEEEIAQTLQGVVQRRILDTKKGVDEDRHILTKERYALKYNQTGWMFNEKGRTHRVKQAVKMTLVHSFSPYVEREASRRFLDPPHINAFFANSPAVIWYKGELILVCRIWLDREKYDPKKDWPPNQFADNYLYTQRFDRHLRPTTNGSIIGIPSPKQWWVGDGPIEPRLFLFKNKPYVSFNAAMAMGYDEYLDFTIIWDLEDHSPIIPKIKGGSPMVNVTPEGEMPRDKHWMACTIDNQLHFIHNFDPLRVLKCSIQGFCEFLPMDYKEKFVFKDIVSHLRGGTPFEHYEDDYYISIAHSTMFKLSNNHRYYTAHLVVMKMHPFRVVYISDDLRVHRQVYRDAPMVRPRWIEDGFIFPVSLIIEDSDSLIIGVHVNDFSSVLLRLQGVGRILKTVIDTDKREAPKSGPPVGYLHKHVHESLQNITGIEFDD